MTFTIDTEREVDGRWIAAVVEIPGALVYGDTTQDAIAGVRALSLRILADRLDHGEGSAENGGQVGSPRTDTLGPTRASTGD